MSYPRLPSRVSVMYCLSCIEVSCIVYRLSFIVSRVSCFEYLESYIPASYAYFPKINAQKSQ